MTKGWCLIPASVFSDTRLSDSEKLLFGKLLGLANKTGYCWAGNKYLADMFVVSERSIQRRLNNLERLGYIKVEQNGRRFIRVVLEGDNSVAGGDSSVVGGVTKLSPHTTKEDLKKDNNKNKLFEDMLCRSVHSFWAELRADNLMERGLMKTRRLPPLTPARKTAIRQAYKNGYSEEDMREAITTVLSSEYHLEGGYTDLTLILRDTKIEQYLAWSVKEERKAKQEDIKELII